MLVLEADSKQRFERIAFSPESRRIAAGNWEGVYCWNLDGPSNPVIHEAEGVNCVAFLPDGRLLIGTIEQGVRIYGTNGTCNVDLLGGVKSRYIAVSPTHPILLQSDLATGRVLCCYRVYASSVVQLAWKVSREVPHTQAFTSDGKQMAIPYSSKRATDGSPLETVSGIRFLNLKKGKQVRDEPLSISLPHLAISPDNSWYASVFENRIRYWNLGWKSQEVRWVENDTPERFCGLAFHPSNRFAAAASNDFSIKLYNLENWQLERTIEWDIGRMRSLAFSPDGALAAAGSDNGKIVVWDVDL